MKKRISLLILIICMVGSIVFFFPKKNTQEVKTVKNEFDGKDPQRFL